MATRQGKTESPTGVDADLQKLTEKMKELCPIVITTVDCRPTKFKDADGNVLSLKDAECRRRAEELSFWGRRLGHNYQTTDKALEYYRLEMKNNCDNKC